MASKPNVLIFGGINGLAPVLALHLIPRSGEPLVSHLRMVDKYSMNPPTTYVKKEFSHLLQDRKDVVEYRQMNLTRIDHIRKSFADPSPNSQPYTHIIDLTGEVLFDRSAEIFISQTLNVSLSIALEASRNPVKSYLRHVPPFYEHVEDKIYKEEDVEGWKPWATRGAWWHESIRAIANIPNLPLVVLRGAEPYGPGLYRGIMPVALMVAFVYGHMDKEMALLWGPQLRRNTINTIDWAGAVWATSVWASDKSRSMLDRAAGVTVLPSGDTLVEETEGTVKKIDGGVVVPTFNLVDEGDTNQVKMASLYRNMFRIKTLFPSDLDSASFEGMSEDINGILFEEWAKIISTSNPPVPSTPLSPMIYSHELKRHGCAMDGSKLRNIIGYKFKYPQFNEESIRYTIESWRAEGIWPNTNIYPPS